MPRQRSSTPFQTSHPYHAIHLPISCSPLRLHLSDNPSHRDDKQSPPLPPCHGNKLSYIPNHLTTSPSYLLSNTKLEHYPVCHHLQHTTSISHATACEKTYHVRQLYLLYSLPRHPRVSLYPPSEYTTRYVSLYH